MGAAMRVWRSDDDGLGSVAMNSDCVVEARYWTSGTQILCRVNHSHMARIREAKGLMELPTRNACLLGAASPEGATADCHFDGSRRVHVHDLGDAAARGARQLAFPLTGPRPAGTLALVR